MRYKDDKGKMDCFAPHNDKEKMNCFVSCNDKEKMDYFAPYNVSCDTAIEVRNVSVSYGETEVLHDVSFQLNEGENLCILGPNGCGKTTLLRAIANLISFDGAILIDGKSVANMKRIEVATKLAFMGQIVPVSFPYSVYETVLLGRYHHMKQSFFAHEDVKDREFVEKCLEVTDLKDLRNRQTDTLSGGQLQRVYLARALAQDPKVILLDEPNNHLDMKHQLELLEYLGKWTADGKHNVIGVFHDMNLALSLSKKLLFMKDGRDIGQGEFKDIVTGNFLQEVFGMDVLG
jgi:iron complex transport system ATP-binding protein